MKNKIVAKFVIFVFFLAFFSLTAYSQDHSWASNYGKVERLYPSIDGTFFKVKGGETRINPESGYFFIALDHPNYKALIDLLYKAAESRWTLYIRTEERLNAKGNAVVVYLVVDL